MKTIKKALTYANTNDATILDHLGEIYSALKMFDEAAKAYGDSLQIKKDPAVEKKLNKVKKKLKNLKPIE